MRRDGRSAPVLDQGSTGVMGCTRWTIQPASGVIQSGRRSTGADMKLYDGGRAPNPRRTRIFLAEKGIPLPMEQVDLGAMAQMSAAYAAINPLKRVPALVLDDGTVLPNRSRSAAISRRSTPIRRCSGAVRWRSRASRCGIGGSNCICSFRSPTSFATRIRP